MNLRVTLGTLAALALSALGIFHLFQRELSGAWFAFGVHPDVLRRLDASLADQKRLARLDPEHAAEYRRSFDSTEALLARLRVIEYNRDDIARRYGLALTAVFGGVLGLVGTAYVVRQSRQASRLARLQSALGDLASGRGDVGVADRGRDLIGRIGNMVEEASRVMSRDRRRLASLENLSAWQEAARRHAHEMRSPLTAAHLELERLRDLVDGDDAARSIDSVAAELERLGRFARDFTAIARVSRPNRRREDLAALVGEFVRLFDGAWPNLRLAWEPPSEPVPVDLDREMLRQVLVNLCENSSRALDERSGSQRLTLREGEGGVVLEVADDGPGVAPEIAARLFEPYATTRRVGEGMGLGLAISRKILLDHGGDLELAATSDRGSTFRLIFPRAT